MTNLQGILKAINEGDREALFPLADLLLEANDPRAPGVLWLIENGKWPETCAEFAGWYGTQPGNYGLPMKVFLALERGWHWHRGAAASDAILDAAQAVVKSGILK